MKNIFFYILFIHSLFVFSQEEQSKTIHHDKQAINPKSFDVNKIESYKNNDDFIYVVEKRESNWVEKAWDWLKRVVKKVLSYFLDDIQPAVGFLAKVLRVLPYIIAGIVLVLIIKFFVKVQMNNVIEGKTKKSVVQISEEEQLIKENDLPNLIDKAIRNGNFRLAIRYYYLLALKNLSEKDLINWKIEKTNEDYIKELRDSKFVNEFKDITFLYDYVWYGNFQIDELAFNRSEKQFKGFINAI